MAFIALRSWNNGELDLLNTDGIMRVTAATDDDNADGLVHIAVQLAGEEFWTRYAPVGPDGTPAPTTDPERALADFRTYLTSLHPGTR